MANNGKKEFAIDGYEQDVLYARRIYCYIHNGKGVTKYIKRKINKRFRKSNKLNKYEF